MISIDWGTKIISIPKSYTQFVSFGTFEIRQLDIDQFRLDLKGLEADVPGIINERTHTHNTTVEVGGVTLARVVTIVNGYTITFENGVYAVNLVGANSNLADVTNLNLVQIRSANSAGLTFSEEINNQSYLGAKVFINTEGLGLPGTQFPRGTPTSPVDNWVDTRVIATNRNFSSFNLHGTLTFSGTTDLSHTSWYGISPTESVIYNSTTPAMIDSSTFERVAIFGLFSGKTSHNEGSLGTLGIDYIGFHGVANNCGISGNIEIGEGDLDTVVFRNCFSTIAGTATPIIDFSKMTNSNASFRGYNGGLQINGFGDTNNLSLDISTGNIILDSSCTGGTIVVRGLCNLIDNSTSGCTVVTNGMLDPSDLTISGGSCDAITISEAVWDAVSSGRNPGSMGQLLLDLLTNSEDAQHTLNVHTEMLKNKPNNC
jgi:hypothetical protein